MGCPTRTVLTGTATLWVSGWWVWLVPMLLSVLSVVGGLFALVLFSDTECSFAQEGHQEISRVTEVLGLCP